MFPAVLRRHLEQVRDHHVLVAEAQVVGVRELLDALDVRLALGEELVEVEEREVDDLRLVAGASEKQPQQPPDRAVVIDNRNRELGLPH